MLKKAKYKTTYDFGNVPNGIIVECYILAIDDDTGEALVYHPPNVKYNTEDGVCTDKGCASFELCTKQGDYYIPLGKNSYINCGKMDSALKKLLSPHKVSKEIK